MKNTSPKNSKGKCPINSIKLTLTMFLTRLEQFWANKKNIDQFIDKCVFFLEGKYLV